MSRFSLRTRLTILVTVAAAITLAVLTVGFNLLLRSNLDADANRESRVGPVGLVAPAPRLDGLDGLEG